MERDDLWAQHHALIKALKGDFAGFIDFDELETNTMDDGRYSEARAIAEWRKEVVAELAGSGD